MYGWNSSFQRVFPAVHAPAVDANVWGVEFDRGDDDVDVSFALLHVDRGELVAQGPVERSS